MLANLATALFEHGRITTTEAKAKRLRPLAERLITFAKRGDLHARRRVMTVVRDKSVVHELFTEIGPRYATRPGGYTRITKIGPRKGDNAPMAVIELVEPLAEAVVAEATGATKRAAKERTATPAAAPAQATPAGRRDGGSRRAGRGRGERGRVGRRRGGRVRRDREARRQGRLTLSGHDPTEPLPEPGRGSVRLRIDLGYDGTASPAGPGSPGAGPSRECWSSPWRG